jgi:hypothetical protein
MLFQRWCSTQCFLLSLLLTTYKDDGKAILAGFSPLQFGMFFLRLKLGIQTLLLKNEAQTRSFVCNSMYVGICK